MTMRTLDHETAINYLKKLGVSYTEDARKKDPVLLVRDIIRGYQEHVPFQCVGMVAQSKAEKHVPTLDEVVEAGLSMEGGVCLTLNTFMCILLRSLNFKAELLNGSYSVKGDTRDHVIVLLKDLRFPEDDHIIDVGCGYPFEGPLAVSELPSTRYHAGHTYRYEKHNDLILRLHHMNDDLDERDEEVLKYGEWRQFFHFDLKPVTFDFYYPYMEPIYTDDKGCDFHYILRAVRFPRQDKTSQGDTIMMAIRNQSLLVGPINNVQKTKVDTSNLADKIKENFPTIPHATVDQAVKNWICIAEDRNKSSE